MIKNDVQIKERLNIVDKINYINFLVSGYFDIDKYGNKKYTPYFREINDVIAFFTYCVTGLEFENVFDENGNKKMESIYKAVTSDEELMNLYSVVFTPYGSGGYYENLQEQLQEINETVMDIVEFEKQKIIHGERERNSFAELMDVIVDKISKVNIDEAMKKIENFSNITKQDIINEYMKSDYHIQNEKSLFDAKQEEIRKLREENTNLRNQISARNVLSAFKN